VNKKLEVNPTTKIPQILFTVYQHVFSSIYLLSSVLDAPYPPPDLLHPMQEKIQILPQGGEHEASQPQQEKTVESAPEPKTEEENKTSKNGSKPTPKPKT
jgi:outer membrane biosynthesis protein TonB